VYLAREGLPDLNAWPAEFAQVANGTHFFRGVELTVAGQVVAQAGNSLQMAGNALRPPLLLQPIEPTHKIQWDASAGAPQPLNSEERNAFSRLQAAVRQGGAALAATVTGPLIASKAGYVLEVRTFSATGVKSIKPPV